jgi:hypothetical protein
MRTARRQRGATILDQRGLPDSWRERWKRNLNAGYATTRVFIEAKSAPVLPAKIPAMCRPYSPTFSRACGGQRPVNRTQTGDKVMDKKTSKSKYVSVSATGEGIMNYAALPPELDGWRRSRLEYGGHAQSCFMEKIVYHPPGSDGYIFDLLFDFWQAPTRNKRTNLLHQITQELERSL